MGNRRRTGLLAAALAVTAVSAVGTPAVAGPAGPCGPTGVLRTFALNDRCDFNSGLDPEKVDSTHVVAALAAAGLFATDVKCADGTSAPIVADPRRLLLVAPTTAALNKAHDVVRGRLGLMAAPAASTPVGPLGLLVPLRHPIDATIFDVLPGLQGDDWSIDLNYFEPPMPNNAFRPADNPIAAIAPVGGPASDGKGRSVLVLDSPSDPALYGSDAVADLTGYVAPHDVDGNALIDEDHGHGVFVTTQIKMLAPAAEVVLRGVHGGQLPASSRWSPMLFSDADLIRTMGSAFGLSSNGPTVRRSFDVVNLSLGGSGCDGIGTRLGLGRFMRDLADIAALRRKLRPIYVAASGNDGGDVKHYPAAWRDEVTIKASAEAVAAAGEPVAAAQIVDIQADLAVGMFAVGSADEGRRDDFSNCGTWVNATADGGGAVGRYPSSTGWAAWSGTSFATSQVSAVLIGATVKAARIGPSVGAC